MTPKSRGLVPDPRVSLKQKSDNGKNLPRRNKPRWVREPVWSGTVPDGKRPLTPRTPYSKGPKDNAETECDSRSRPAQRTTSGSKGYVFTLLNTLVYIVDVNVTFGLLRSVRLLKNDFCPPVVNPPSTGSEIGTEVDNERHIEILLWKRRDLELKGSTFYPY